MKLFGWLIPPWAYGIAAALALVGAFSGGWTVRRWKDTAHEVAALKAAEIAFRAQLDKQAKESTAYENEREQARQSSNARQDQIRTIYRDKAVPAVCAPDPVAVGLLQGAVDDANTAAGRPRQPVRAAP